MPVPIKLNQPASNPETSEPIAGSGIDLSTLLSGINTGGLLVKTADANDAEAEMLFDLWSTSRAVKTGERVQDREYSVHPSFPTNKLMRLRSNGLVEGSGNQIRFTERAARVIRTFVLGENNSFRKNSVKKPYSVILATSKPSVRRGHKTSQITITPLTQTAQNYRDKPRRQTFPYPSKSSDTVHEAILYTDGTTSCSCPAWRFQKHDLKGNPLPRTCPHVRDIERKFGTAPTSAQTPIPTAPAAVPSVRSKPRSSPVQLSLPEGWTVNVDVGGGNYLTAISPDPTEISSQTFDTAVTTHGEVEERIWEKWLNVKYKNYKFKISHKSSNSGEWKIIVLTKKGNEIAAGTSKVSLKDVVKKIQHWLEQNGQPTNSKPSKPAAMSLPNGYAISKGANNAFVLTTPEQSTLEYEDFWTENEVVTDAWEMWINREMGYTAKTWTIHGAKEGYYGKGPNNASIGPMNSPEAVAKQIQTTQTPSRPEKPPAKVDKNKINEMLSRMRPKRPPQMFSAHQPRILQIAIKDLQ